MPAKASRIFFHTNVVVKSLWMLYTEPGKPLSSTVSAHCCLYWQSSVVAAPHCYCWLLVSCLLYDDKTFSADWVLLLLHSTRLKQVPHPSGCQFCSSKSGGTSLNLYLQTYATRCFSQNECFFSIYFILPVHMVCTKTSTMLNCQVLTVLHNFAVWSHINCQLISLMKVKKQFESDSFMIYYTVTLHITSLYLSTNMIIIIKGLEVLLIKQRHFSHIWN